MWDEIIFPFPNFNDVTVAVWEWTSNLSNTSVIVYVVTYPWWDLKLILFLVKGTPDTNNHIRMWYVIPNMWTLIVQYWKPEKNNGESMERDLM